MFGVPVRVISDRGPQFTAKIWQEVLSQLGISAALASSHHPQSDRQSERSIQTFLCLLRTFTAKFPASWEDKLPLLQFAINNAMCVATQTTPFRVIFGKDPSPPPTSLLDSSSAASGSNQGELGEEERENRDVYVTKLFETLTAVWDFVD